MYEKYIGFLAWSIDQSLSQSLSKLIWCEKAERENISYGIFRIFPKKWQNLLATNLVCIKILNFLLSTSFIYAFFYVFWFLWTITSSLRVFRQWFVIVRRLPFCLIEEPCHSGMYWKCLDDEVHLHCKFSFDLILWRMRCPENGSLKSRTMFDSKISTERKISLCLNTAPEVWCMFDVVLCFQ